MHLRNRLLVLVLSVLIPVFIAAVVAVAYVYQEEQENQERALKEAARAFALLVDNELQTKEAILRTLAKSPTLVQGDWRGFYDYANEMAPESAIIVMMANGEQLLNTRRPYGAPLPTRSISNLLELAKQYGDEKTIFSDVFISPLGNKYDFALRVPVKVGDGSPYSLVMNVNVFELNKVMTAQHFPKLWLASVVDRQGRVVARSRTPEQYIGKTMRAEGRRIVQATSEGWYSSKTLDGVQVKTFISRIPIADWKVLISIPETDIKRTSVEATAFLAVILVILLIFAVVAAGWVARWIIVPIEGLGQAAERLGQGEEAVYVPHGMREVDMVGRTIVQASEKIHQSKSELRQRVDEAVATARRAEGALLQSRKLEALGRLTGGIAHEFNNLLQTLTTSLQLAELSTREPNTQRLVQTAYKAVDRATALTRQLSAFGRIQDARLETVDLNERISGFLQLIKGVLPGNIDFQSRLSSDVWPVTIDPLQLELALLNIALNARDAMPAGGRLHLEIGNINLSEPAHELPAGDYVRVCMADNGSGMTPENLSRALDPFFTTKEVGKGSGLGLAQAYAFATQANGTLLLDSTEGKGTTVEIYLPRASQPIHAAAASHDAVDAANTAAHKGNILFVEDDELVRESVVPALQAAGFHVLVAATADEALRILETNHVIDALFSDVVMPGETNGIELASRVKERFPRMKVILTTGYSEKRLSLPGVQLLAKPYDMSRVMKLLSAPD